MTFAKPTNMERKMTRQATTEDEEYERLKALAVKPEYKNRKRELFAQQASDFAGMLEPEVRQGLEQEASSEVAEEWIGEARGALGGILELPQGWEQTKEFKEAANRVQQGLTEQFCRDALKPSEDEIKSHARELAQCVLANWISILEHAKQDHAGQALRLSANGIPVSVKFEDLYKGVEAYAVPLDNVTRHFQQYLGSLRKTKDVVELAPSLFLAQTTEQMYLASSADEAEGLVAKTAVKDEVPDAILLLKRVYDVIAPYLDTTPGLFWRSRRVAPVMAFMDKEMEQHLAMAAAHSALEANIAEPLLVELAEDKKLDMEISADLATFAILELQQAVGADLWTNIVSRKRQRDMVKNLTNEVQTVVSEEAVACLYRVTVAATGYAVAGKFTMCELRANAYAPMLKRFLETNPQAHNVFCISARAAKQALTMPEATSISSRMSQRIAGLYQKG